jgi:hypothetical protein
VPQTGWMSEHKIAFASQFPCEGTNAELQCVAGYAPSYAAVCVIAQASTSGFGDSRPASKLRGKRHSRNIIAARIVNASLRHRVTQDGMSAETDTHRSGTRPKRNPDMLLMRIAACTVHRRSESSP